MVVTFLKILAGSFVASALAILCMLVLSVDDALLIDYATVSFFLMFSLLYFRSIRTEGNFSIFAIYKLAKQITVWSFVSIVLFGIIVVGMWLSSVEPYIPKKYHWNFSPALLILSAAVFEETFLRGYIFSTLRLKLPAFMSSILSSTIFSLFHAPFAYGFLQFLSHFSFGMFACMLVLRFNSLIPGIIMHAIFNYCIGSSHLPFEMAKSHTGLVHFHSATRSESFLAFQSIVLLAAIIVVPHLKKLQNLFLSRKNH